MLQTSRRWGISSADNILKYPVYGNLVNVGKTTAWELHWRKKIPYTGRPEAMQIFINAWSELWCIASPGIGFDFGNEVLSTGQPNDRGFYFARGEKQYLMSWDDREPWRFIPYGQLAINVLRQHFRISESWTVTFHQVGPSTDKRTAHELPRDYESANIQPEYENAMYHTVPGSMITYDWGIDRILTPILLKKNMSNNNWHLIESTPVVANSPDAGFLLDSPAVAFEMQHSAPNF